VAPLKWYIAKYFAKIQAQYSAITFTEINCDDGKKVKEWPIKSFQVIAASGVS
jgi:hypothetical protein